MSEQTQKALSEAFDLIEADKLDEARAILVPMLTTHRDNPDVWWLYAHAVADADTARMALYNVMRLDPNYPGASELLDQLEKQVASPHDRVTAAESEPAFLADIPATLPDLPDLEDEKEFEDVDLDLEETPEAEPASRSRLLLLAVLGILAVLVIVAIALLTSRPRGPVTPTPTSEVIAAQPSSTPLVMLPETTTEPVATLEIATEVTEATPIEATEEAALEISPTAEAATTEVSSIAATEEAAAETPSMAAPVETEAAVDLTAESIETLEATAETLATQPSAVVTGEAGTPEIIGTAEVASTDTVEVLTQALSAYTLSPGGIGTEQTRLGNTLVAGVCTDAGLELRSTLPAVMDIIAKQPLDVPVDAVGVRLTDCASAATLRLIVVPLADALSYASGSLSEEDFQAQWKSL
jgi:cytoskeletal protein RodZ